MEGLSEEVSSKGRSQTLIRLSRLPVFNQTALKLITIATDSESAREDFELAFRADPSLATDLLILANSSEFGFRARVTSIPHALSMLGLERARSLACAIAMSFYLRRSANTDVNAAWTHCMASAALAEHLAQASSLSLPILYTASLLHDIGRLGLQLTAQKEYGSIMELPVSAIDELLAVERIQFGMNHCEAGGALARTWGFPESLQRPIHLHHDRTPLEQDPVTNLVQTSCRMAEALGYPETTIVPGASRVGLEEATPPRLRGHESVKPELLEAVVSAQFAMTSRIGAAASS
jgi:putative nucleotidyltransferase with HDIG domain